MQTYRYTPLYKSSSGILSSQLGKRYNMIPISGKDIDHVRKNLMEQNYRADQIIIWRGNGRTKIGHMCFKGRNTYWTPVNKGIASDHKRLINKDGSLGKVV